MKDKLQRDFSAYEKKVISQPGHEVRGGDLSMEMLAKTIVQVCDKFEDLKNKHDENAQQIRSHVERLETRLSRPGALPSATGAELDRPQYIKTRAGQMLPLLSAKQRLSDIEPGDRADFSIGEFARDAIVGSTKAASGPALVPTGLANAVIDRVRQATVLVEAGASTIIVDQPTNVARLTGDPTVHQHTEGANDITESDILAEAVALNPKALVALVPLTMELVSDSPNLDMVLNASLAAAFAAKLDALGLAALLADIAIPKSAATQDPAIWAKTLEAVGAALAANQKLPMAHISAPADFIARASQLASTSGTWLGKPPALASMKELQTAGLSAGTALFGDFAAGFAFAMRQELRLEVIRFAKPGSASHLLVAHMRADGIVIQPAQLFKQLKTVT
jgi:hypothetical protein